MSKEHTTPEEKPYLQDLFEHMSNEHGLILLQSEMQDIVSICNEPLSSELTQLRDALQELIELIEQKNFHIQSDIESHRICISIDKAKELLNHLNTEKK